MHILGINAYHGNASAAIIADGRLVAAVEEERFNRVKYAAGFPAAAIRYCLDTAGITLREVDHIAIPRNPWARLGTKLWYAVRMPSFATERAKVLTQFVGIPEALAKAFDVSPDSIRAKFHRVEHHQAHLASTFFVSPFDQAALLSADGLGDFASTMWGVGRANQMHVVFFKHSAVGKFDGKIERGLSAHGRQNSEARTGRHLSLDANDLFEILASKRLDVSAIRGFGIGHDGGRVRVSQHNFKTLRLKRLASLRAGVVELRGLADDDRAGAED